VNFRRGDNFPDTGGQKHGGNMQKSESSYTKSKLNSKYFGAKRRGLESFFPSTRYFVNDSFIKKGMNFLDVGGGGGTLLMLFHRKSQVLMQR
jgi:2-polyprenyl-3-methyl-5-hydroxy-6-metoxy-1,4-benzoquinol methylase